MGQIAALLTAACWAVSSVFFTSSSKEVGAVVVNRMRILLAVILLVAAHQVLTGSLLPLDAGTYRWLWLGLSGIVGLVVGDTLLFQAYSLIGNRLAVLLMSSVPVISSLAAWLFLGETLDFLTVLGILVCSGGIALVVMERPGNNGSEGHIESRRFTIGVLCGLGGAVGQAVGLILAKKGLAGDFPSISGTVIRMLVAMVFIWGIAILTGQARQTFQKITSSSSTMRNIMAGTVVGPFLGVWLSQIAIQQTYVGIASTLMAMTPIFVLPIAKWHNKENVSLRAVIGTMIALSGVAIIFI
jgi:drug/metabolite transporter (DMT)-like permease